MDPNLPRKDLLLWNPMKKAISHGYHSVNHGLEPVSEILDLRQGTQMDFKHPRGCLGGKRGCVGVEFQSNNILCVVCMCCTCMCVVCTHNVYTECMAGNVIACESLQRLSRHIIQLNNKYNYYYYYS